MAQCQGHGGIGGVRCCRVVQLAWVLRWCKGGYHLEHERESRASRMGKWQQRDC